MAASSLEPRGGSPLSAGTRIGPMSPAEVKNLFFRLMSSGRNGGGGRQESSAVSEGEPLPSPMTLPAAPASRAPAALPDQQGRGAPGALAHAGEGPLCMERAGRQGCDSAGQRVSSQHSRTSWPTGCALYGSLAFRGGGGTCWSCHPATFISRKWVFGRGARAALPAQASSRLLSALRGRSRSMMLMLVGISAPHAWHQAIVAR